MKWKIARDRCHRQAKNAGMRRWRLVRGKVVTAEVVLMIVGSHGEYKVTEIGRDVVGDETDDLLAWADGLRELVHVAWLDGRQRDAEFDRRCSEEGSFEVGAGEKVSS